MHLLNNINRSQIGLDVIIIHKRKFVCRVKIIPAGSPLNIYQNEFISNTAWSQHPPPTSKSYLF